MKIHEYQAKAILAIRRADSARRNGHHAGSSARGGRAAGHEDRRGEGANSRRRPRQGGRREAGEIADEAADLAKACWA